MKFKLEIECETVEFENALTNFLEKASGEGFSKKEYNETRGVKPGTTRGKYKKHENGTGSETGEDSDSGANESAVSTPETEAPKAVTPPSVAPKSEKPEGRATTPPKQKAAQDDGRTVQSKPAAKLAEEKEEAEEIVNVPSLQDALDALKKVNLEVNTDVARACLADFGAARCSAIPEDKREAFIALCNSKIPAKKG